MRRLIYGFACLALFACVAVFGIVVWCVAQEWNQLKNSKLTYVRSEILAIESAISKFRVHNARNPLDLNELERDVDFKFSPPPFCRKYIYTSISSAEYLIWTECEISTNEHPLILSNKTNWAAL